MSPGAFRGGAGKLARTLGDDAVPGQKTAFSPGHALLQDQAHLRYTARPSRRRPRRPPSPCSRGRVIFLARVHASQSTSFPRLYCNCPRIRRQPLTPRLSCHGRTPPFCPGTSARELAGHFTLLIISPAGPEHVPQSRSVTSSAVATGYARCHSRIDFGAGMVTPELKWPTTHLTPSSANLLAAETPSGGPDCRRRRRVRSSGPVHALLR